jgi:hypothetical protein
MSTFLRCVAPSRRAVHACARAHPVCVSCLRLLQSMKQQCRPMFAYAERITDWFMHGYYADEICEKIKLCAPGFFDY